MMKFVVVNLAAFVATAVSTLPVLFVSASDYQCQVKAVFETMADAIEPAVPTKMTLEWVSGTILTSFESSYQSNNDMDMIDEKFRKFSMTRKPTFAAAAADATTDEEDSTIWGEVIRNLRVGKKPPVEQDVPYDLAVYTKVGIWCRFCRNDDDATTALGLNEESSILSSDPTPMMIEQAITESPEHQLWVAHFCSSIQTSEDFSDATSCTIVLSDCHEGGSTDAEDEADATGIDNYIVSDGRGRENEEGTVVYALQVLENE
jgi:hypothetical protein